MTTTTEAPATHAPALPPKPVDRFRQVFTAGVVAVVVWSLVGLDVRWSRLLEAPADLWTLGRLMFTQMDLSELGGLVGAMWESISIAWMGTLIAAVFAVPMSFLAAENLVGRPVAWVTRQVFNLLRAIPEVLLAVAFIPIFGLTPLTGVMAIGVGSIGTLGKLFYEIIEGIQRGPLEAADAVGANRSQRLRWGVLPQVTPELASFILYRFEVNIRASAVMGLVGAGGIGSDLALYIEFNEFGSAGLALIIVVLGTIAVDAVSGFVRRRIVAGRPSLLEIDRSFEAQQI
ncbi:MAG: phosphonate ABC transporter, permease protein PhnE [Actinomycetota bacterium]|nr:phosphonate ABC transporter, permease protein PhnE [Actinomycetota bacterium]